MRQLSQRVAAFLVVIASAIVLHAQTPARIAQPVSETELRTVPNTAAPFAQPEIDTGRVASSAPMQRMLLSLTPSDDQEANLERLIDAQKDPASPEYQRWLTPQQYGSQFGPADSDVQQISAWLEQHGFRIDQVAAGRQWIEFSGTASQVESAFRTEMHRYTLKGKQYIGNATDISLPVALARVVSGLVSLNNYEKPPMRSGATFVSVGDSGSLTPAGSFNIDAAGSISIDPTYTLISASGTHHFLSPGDFQNIYNIAPLLKDGTDGSGVSVAIVGRSDIRLSDVLSFREIFGLPRNDPHVITNGADPGYTGDELEADLDVEWAGAAAPHATITYVTSATTASTDGVDLSAAYIVDHRIAPIVSVSYGLCEAMLGPVGNAFYKSLWQQAAAEGITVFVSSGDNGAAGCDPISAYQPAQSGRMVSGLASTPYNVAVGGTEFNENGSDSVYWATQNNADQSSAFGYIPEAAWNESCDPTQDSQKCGDSKYHLVAGSGGPSNCSNVTWIQTGNQRQITCNGGYDKPPWQAGPNVPADGVRDLPDVSLAAAGSHDGYLVCIEGECQSTFVNGQRVLKNAVVVGGTSASSPSMAGIMALVEQRHGAFLGLTTYNFYQLAAAEQASQCDASLLLNPFQPDNCVFRDITQGNNTVPGLTGYDAIAGYDMATGLGSINAANLVARWPAGDKLETATTLQTSTRRVQHGQPITITGRVVSQAPTGLPSGYIALSAGPYGYAADSLPLTAGLFSSQISDLPGGKYALRAHYNGSAMYSGSDSNPISVEIAAESSTVTVQPYNLNLVNAWVPTQGGVFYGTSVGLAVKVQGASGVGSATGTLTVLDGALTLGTVPITGGSAWVPLDPFLTASLELGTHNFSVQYSGDNSFEPSQTTEPVGVTIIKAFANFVRIIGDVTNLPVGVPEHFHLVVLTPGTAVPSGTVQVFDNNLPITGPITLDATVPKGAYQALYTGAFAAGIHALRVSYSGDSRYNAVAVPSFRDPQFTVTVTGAAGAGTQVRISQASASITVGQSETYIVRVVAATPSQQPPPTGTVWLTGQYGYLAAGPVPLVSGLATLTVPWSTYLSTGQNQLLAQYSGDSTFAPNISREIWTTVLPTTPAISVSADAPASSGALTTLTADLAPTLTDPKVSLPFGQVQFYDSVNGAPQVALGPAQSLQMGDGNFTTFVMASTLPRGTNVITAQYLGSPNGEWGPVTSDPVTVVLGIGKHPGF